MLLTICFWREILDMCMHVSCHNLFELQRSFFVPLFSPFSHMLVRYLSSAIFSNLVTEPKWSMCSMQTHKLSLSRVRTHIQKKNNSSSSRSSIKKNDYCEKEIWLKFLISCAHAFIKITCKFASHMPNSRKLCKPKNVFHAFGHCHHVSHGSWLAIALPLLRYGTFVVSPENQYDGARKLNFSLSPTKSNTANAKYCTAFRQIVLLFKSIAAIS